MEHVNITNADCHEPKHITDTTAADVGKVITAVGDGTSELRFLQESEVDGKIRYFKFTITDLIPATTGIVDSAQTMPVPFNGQLVYVGVNLQGTALPAGTDNTLHVVWAASGTTHASLSTANSVGNVTLPASTAAYSCLSSTPSSSNSFSAGGYLALFCEVTVAAIGAVPASVVIGLKEVMP